MGFIELFGDSEEKKGRPQWQSRWTFILASIGAAIGLGNFWRFPSLTYEWGGAGFFIPYLFALIFIGLPICLMELSMGQIFQRGDIGVFRKMWPRLSGIGAASVVSGYTIVLYYNVVIAWAIYYFFAALGNSTVPWSESNYDTENNMYTNDAGVETYYYNCKEYHIAEEYFLQKVGMSLNEDCTEWSDDTPAAFNWPVYLSVLFVWLCIYFTIWKGTDSTGYIVWITVPFPALLVLVLLIKGMNMEGWQDGIAMYLKGTGSPIDISVELRKEDIWTSAVGQIFFSIGVCMGILTSYGSYNKQDKSIIRDAYIIALSNSLMSFFAGFAVFCVVGYLNNIGHELSDKTSGTGLAFIAYPTALEYSGTGGRFWSILLFLTLFTLGIDSAFAMVEACATVVLDTPNGRKYPRKFVAFVFCILGAALSSVFCFNFGLVLFDVIDKYNSDLLMIFLGVLQCWAVGWIYDWERVQTKFSAKSWKVLNYGYWVPLIIIGIYEIAMNTGSIYLFVVWLVLFLIAFIYAWKVTDMSFGEWYYNIGIGGCKGFAEKMTKLGLDEDGIDESNKGCILVFFEHFWCFQVKYFCPMFLFAMNVRKICSIIYDDPYGGYSAKWQALGLLGPIIGYLAFFISFAMVTEPEEEVEKKVEADKTSS